MRRKMSEIKKPAGGSEPGCPLEELLGVKELKSRIAHLIKFLKK